MTVKQLIDKISKCDPKMSVLTSNGEFLCEPEITITKVKEEQPGEWYENESGKKCLVL